MLLSKITLSNVRFNSCEVTLNIKNSKDLIFSSLKCSVQFEVKRIILVKSNSRKVRLSHQSDCSLIDSYIYFYWPQQSCGQGNIFTPVCHSVHRGGLPQCMLGYHPPREQSPLEQTPQSRHPLGQTPPPPEQTPPKQTPPWEQTPPEADSSIRSTSGRYASYWNAFLY